MRAARRWCCEIASSCCLELGIALSDTPLDAIGGRLIDAAWWFAEAGR